ncbi:P-type conjugative transfer protein TrbG [Brevundimonas sp. LM2]|uniref:P-type conjugative transfer protein TrbG n=1 Tax=Brevundimonas sp. LM2 TaxID=1938605 RepID=UPI000983F584|nr:P-type conjugative transfer protein TrbG [Brevundimonas sp. LM2]AQR61701.1 P-type conjugative transfer protein TrbG [Brevundimonas sp. LM2]
MTRLAILLVLPALSACALSRPAPAPALLPTPAIVTAPLADAPQSAPTPLPPLPDTAVPYRALSPHPEDDLSPSEAIALARVEPSASGWRGAVQVYDYDPGALFQVWTAPGQVTDLALQPGERLVGSGPIAAGDTARWILGDTISGAGAGVQVHVLVKPTEPGLHTNLILNTDRRTYRLELRSRSQDPMPAVAWRFPAEEAAAAQAALSAALPVPPWTPPPVIEAGYRIEGPAVAWRPLRAWDDGVRTVIEFAPDIVTRDLPPLFLVGRRGRSELVNYRVRDRWMIVDRLFDRAELRLGDRAGEVRVQIVRGDR